MIAKKVYSKPDNIPGIGARSKHGGELFGKPSHNIIGQKDTVSRVLGGTKSRTPPISWDK